MQPVMSPDRSTEQMDKLLFSMKYQDALVVTDSQPQTVYKEGDEALNLHSLWSPAGGDSCGSSLDS